MIGIEAGGALLHHEDRAGLAGDLAGARAALAGLTPDRLANPDYLVWLRGQIALLDGQPADAARDFAALAATPDSRFARAAAWRAADAAWEQGQRADAAAAYQRLRAAADADEHADLGVVAYRIALAAGDADPARGQAALRGFLRAYPTHPLAADADRALAAAGAAPTYSDDDRIERAQRMITAHAWDGAVAELAQIDARAPKAIRIRRDYWLGTALFKMRRRYADAGKLLLGVADEYRPAAPTRSDVLRALERRGLLTFVKALQALDTAITVMPSDVRLRLDRARLLRRIERLRLAHGFAADD